MDSEEIQESFIYLRGVFPSSVIFDLLVEEGARGDEYHTLRGDDLAGACWHLNRLIEHFGVQK